MLQLIDEEILFIRQAVNCALIQSCRKPRFSHLLFPGNCAITATSGEAFESPIRFQTVRFPAASPHCSDHFLPKVREFLFPFTTFRQLRFRRLSVPQKICICRRTISERSFSSCFSPQYMRLNHIFHAPRPSFLQTGHTGIGQSYADVYRNDVPLHRHPKASVRSRKCSQCRTGSRRIRI